MDDCINYESYIGRHVKVKSSDKYVYKKVIGKSGIVTKLSSFYIGVAIEGYYNKASSYGVFWFDKDELEFLERESENNVMEGFKYIAIVNMLEDCYKKDYAFALYEEDFALFDCINNNAPAMVVVNAINKNNRQLAILKDVVSVDKYNGAKITAEVVGVVNMNNYIAREEEKVRLEELAKKRAAIEAELEKEINKKKSVEYYEEMAKKYSDNPRLAELVGELKSLGD